MIFFLAVVGDLVPGQVRPLTAFNKDRSSPVPTIWFGIKGGPVQPGLNPWFLVFEDMAGINAVAGAGNKGVGPHLEVVHYQVMQALPASLPGKQNFFF